MGCARGCLVSGACGLCATASKGPRVEDGVRSSRLELHESRALRASRARALQEACRWMMLVGAPGVMAAVVVFFFPVAAHAIHPGSWRLGSYRISIPWTQAIQPPAHVPERFIRGCVCGYRDRRWLGLDAILEVRLVFIGNGLWRHRCGGNNSGFQRNHAGDGTRGSGRIDSPGFSDGRRGVELLAMSACRTWSLPCTQ